MEHLSWTDYLSISGISKEMFQSDVVYNRLSAELERATCEQKRRRDEKREMERAIFELYLDDERSRQDCRILGVELDLAIEDEERATERVKYFADRLLFTQLFMCDDDESWEEFEWEDA